MKRLLPLLVLALAGCNPGPGSPTPGASGASPAAAKSPGAAASPAASVAPAAGAGTFVVEGKAIVVDGQIALDHFQPGNFTAVWGQLGFNVNKDARMSLEFILPTEKGKTGSWGAADLQNVNALMTLAKRGVYTLDWNVNNPSAGPCPCTMTVAGGKCTIAYKGTLKGGASGTEAVAVEASVTDAAFNKKF